MSAAEASLDIELNVTCPQCDCYFDLMDEEHGLNEGGELMQSACPSGDWSAAHENFKAEVSCPDCKQTISITNIAW